MISSSVFLFFFQELSCFFDAVEESYSDNPYHCFRHAFDVCQTLFSMVCRIEEEQPQFSPVEIVSILIAALCHDLGHPGVSNKFMIATSHELALRYNDRSVLENYHCALAFDLLRRPSCDFLRGASASVRKQMRDIIITCILGTDMGQHFSLMSKLEARAASHGAIDKAMLLEALVHAADLSNVCKPWELCYKWSSAIASEFFSEGDKLKALGLPCEAYADRTQSTVEVITTNFIRFVCVKYFVMIRKLFPCIKMDELAEANLQKFSERMMRN